MKFVTIEEYYCAYQEAYDNIASQLANKKGHKDQIKFYKNFLQEVIFDKLPKTYALFISIMDKNWLDYTNIHL